MARVGSNFTRGILQSVVSLVCVVALGLPGPPASANSSGSVSGLAKGEDIGLDKVSIKGGSQCVGIPVGGITIVDGPTFCDSGSQRRFSVSGGAEESSSGLTFLWEESLNGGASWSPAPFTNDEAGYVVQVSQQRSFRRQLTCVASGGSAVSTPVTVSEFVPVAFAVAPGNPFFEGFGSWVSRCNNSDVPSENWRTRPPVGNRSWRRQDQGVTTGGWTSNSGQPVLVAANEGFVARFNTWNVPSGQDGLLDLHLDLSAPGAKELSFLYRNSSGTDRLEVLVSEDGGTSFSLPQLSLTTNSAWITHRLELSTGSAQAVIRFRAVSDFGTTDIGLDNVRVALLAPPDLELIKSDGGLAAQPGNRISYTLQFRQVGAVPATDVVLTETVPLHTVFDAAASTSGWNCASGGMAGSACTLSLGELAPDASGAATFAVILNDPLPLDLTQVVNVASIADDGSAGPDPTPQNNEASVQTSVIVNPQLGIEIAFGAAPNPITAGAAIQASVTAVNTGNMTLTNVVVNGSELEPASRVCSTIAPGEGCLLSGTFTISQPQIDAGQIEFSASAGSGQTALLSASRNLSLVGTPGLALTKALTSQSATPIVAGTVLTYTVTATNSGNLTLRDVTIMDNRTTPSSVTCLMVGVGSNCILVGSYVVTSSDVVAREITNVATANATTLNGDPLPPVSDTLTTRIPPGSVVAVPLLGLPGLWLMVLALLGLGAYRLRSGAGP